MRGLRTTRATRDACIKHYTQYGVTAAALFAIDCNTLEDAVREYFADMDYANASNNDEHLKPRLDSLVAKRAALRALVQP